MPENTWKLGDGSRIDIPASDCALVPSTGVPHDRKDQRGHRQGRLTVQEFAGFQLSNAGQKRPIWLCQCDCGNFITAHVGFSKTLAQSCGCLRSEYIFDCLRDHGGASNDASPAKRKVHLAWRNQLQNCYSPNAIEYPTIGARGIKVCDRWINNFPQFLEDVGLPPTLDHSLSRLDFDKDYEPSNVRWFPKTEQRKRVAAYQKRLRANAPPKEQPYKDQLILLVKQHPEANLVKYAELLAAATGVRLHKGTIHKYLQNLGLSRKEQRAALART
jgi:hypothetical protein